MLRIVIGWSIEIVSFLIMLMVPSMFEMMTISTLTFADEHMHA